MLPPCVAGAQRSLGPASRSTARRPSPRTTPPRASTGIPSAPHLPGLLPKGEGSGVRCDPAGGVGELARGQPEYVLECGCGCGAIWVEQRGGHHAGVPRLAGGVCAERARINRRLPPPGHTPGAGRPPAPGVCLPRGLGASLRSTFVSGWPGRVVSRPALGRPWPGKGHRRRRETRPGAARPRSVGLMDRAAPGSGVSSLPLLLALALGKWRAGHWSPRRKVCAGVAGRANPDPRGHPDPRARWGWQGPGGAL